MFDAILVGICWYDIFSIFISIPKHILLPQQLWNFRPFEGAFIVSQIFILSPGVVQVIPEERPSGSIFQNQPVFQPFPNAQCMAYLATHAYLPTKLGSFGGI